MGRHFDCAQFKAKHVQLFRFGASFFQPKAFFIGSISFFFLTIKFGCVNVTYNTFEKIHIFLQKDPLTPYRLQVCYIRIQHPFATYNIRIRKFYKSRTDFQSRKLDKNSNFEINQNTPGGMFIRKLYSGFGKPSPNGSGEIVNRRSPHSTHYYRKILQVQSIFRKSKTR